VSARVIRERPIFHFRPAATRTLLLPFSLSHSKTHRLSTSNRRVSPSPLARPGHQLPGPAAMGKAARWFRSFLGKKDQATTKGQRRQQDQALPPPASAKRWSFGKSSRDSAEAAAAATAAAAVVSPDAGNAAIARAAEAAWLRSAACAETDRDREQSKHAIAVAAATAAAADAAVAAAQAAVAVVRLTSKGRPPSPVVLAAVRIQTVFRGFLVRGKTTFFLLLLSLHIHTL
jgi:hypothetical protein